MQTKAMKNWRVYIILAFGQITGFTLALSGISKYLLECEPLDLTHRITADIPVWPSKAILADRYKIRAHINRWLTVFHLNRSCSSILDIKKMYSKKYYQYFSKLPLKKNSRNCKCESK